MKFSHDKADLIELPEFINLASDQGMGAAKGEEVKPLEDLGPLPEGDQTTPELIVNGDNMEDTVVKFQPEMAKVRFRVRTK